MYDDSSNAIWWQLWEYYQTPAPLLLSQALYQLIAEYATVGADNQRMPELFTRFLNHEARYYRQVGKLHSSEALTTEDLKSLAKKRSIALQDMIEQAQEATSEVGTGEIARQLLLAACYQQVQEPDKVVAHLEKALADGADEPLVYFALGYNRFHLALESFGPIVALTDHSDSANDLLLPFQMACLQAVAAFENALTGQDSDSQVYEWIGRVLETAGFEEAADQAFDKANDLAYSNNADDELADVYRGLELEDDSFSIRLSQKLGPITQEEIAEFGKLLQGKHNIYELWPNQEDNEEA